jgi:hypothetical protein
MDKQYFQRMFCANAGRVYKFVGSVPAEQSPSVYVTEQFLGSVVRPSSTSTVVVEVQDQIVLFTNTVEDINDAAFVLLADLAPEVVVVEEQPAPAEGGV